MTGTEERIGQRKELRLSWQEIFTWLFKDHSVILLFIGLFTLAALISPSFLRINNIQNILIQYAIVGFLSIGQTLVIISGGIDLTVGAVLALTTMVCALLDHYGFPASLLIGLFLGAFIGFLNGVLTTRFKLLPFIVTLAMMGIVRSIAALLTGGTHVVTETFKFLNSITIGSLPLMVVLWLVLTLVMQYLMSSTPRFRHLLAIGGDEECARTSGINTGRLKIMAYSLSGLLSSVGAVYYLSRLGNGHYTLGGAFNMDSIAAVVIGGASIYGGRGSFVNTFFGVLILGVLDNIINLLNINIYVKDAFKGIIILTIILIAVIRRNKEINRQPGK